MPNDKYEEQQRRQEDFDYEHSKKLWDFIFNLSGCFWIAVIVTALIIVLTR